jgi:hypothetical protein
MNAVKGFAIRVALLAQLVVLLMAVPQSAKAYTDPGTGAMLWQALAASFVGLMFYARRILRFFRRDSQKPATEAVKVQQP